MPADEQRRRAEEEGVLVARIARRDTRALEALYLRFRPRLHRFLLALGCQAGHLDELCNETFYTVWRKAGTFDGTSRLSTWIFGIARNKALDLLRRERRAHRLDGNAELELLPGMRISDAERIELGEQLAHALDELPPLQRSVVELAFFEGLAYQEIAQLMGCPEATVKTRMFHARRKLRACFPEFADAHGKRNSR